MVNFNVYKFTNSHKHISQYRDEKNIPDKHNTISKSTIYKYTTTITCKNTVDIKIYRIKNYFIKYHIIVFFILYQYNRDKIYKSDK